MNKYTNNYCEEVARLSRIEGLTYRINTLIKINYTTLHELDDEIKTIEKPKIRWKIKNHLHT